MPDTHAKLSASGSKRWMECPGSVILESYYGESESPYADEGTKAHALAEELLTAETQENPLKLAEACKKADSEMLGYVADYVEYCMDLYHTMTLAYRDAIIRIEERVDFSPWVPRGFGTSDCLIIGGDRIHVIDLKYGKGVPVDAQDNPQARLYALGAVNEYGFIFDLKKVTTHIVQPRLDSITTEDLTVKDLLAWGKKEAKPKAKAAYNGTREFRAGKHCKFCKARATCRLRANEAIATLKKFMEEF